MKAEYLNYYNSLNLDFLICPGMSIPANPHRTGTKFMASLSYTMLYALLDYASGTVPIDKVDPKLDQPWDESAKFNAFEKQLHEFYTPEKFTNAPTGVQVVCRRLEEEKTLEVMKVLDEAVKSYKAKGRRGEGYRELAMKEFRK